MDEHDPREREALDALRAADPAAGLTPDAARLQAALRAAGAPAEDETTVLVRTTDELAARRRVPRRWFQAVAAVAGVVVVGGAGFLAGTGVGGAAVAGGATDGAMVAGGAAADQGGAERDSAAPVTPLTPDGSAPSAPGSLSGMGTAEGRSSFVGYGRTVFTSSGLSAAGGSRHVYGFDAQGSVSKAGVQRIAKALGLQGTAREEYGVWYVEDGTRTLSLQPDAIGSLSYADAAHDPWACEKVAAPDAATSSGGGSSSSLGTPEPAPLPQPACDDATGATVPRARAEALVADFLGAVGLDAGDFAVEVSTQGVKTATATLTADGAPTGLAWSFTLTDDQVQSAWGGIAPLVDLGAYDVVSPRVAVERLGDPRFGSSWGWAAAARGVATSAADDAAKAAESGSAVDPSVPEATVPPTPEPGADLAWPVQRVTITSATLGSQVQWLGDGSAVLAPTWTLRSADGGEWTVVAVADDQLDFSAR